MPVLLAHCGRHPWGVGQGRPTVTSSVWEGKEGFPSCAEQRPPSPPGLPGT